jgi:hypothetical protein
MSHILNLDGRYFRVEIVEVASADNPDKPRYAAWCSEAFRELKDAPSQALSRFIDGPSQSTHAAALRHAYEWIKANAVTPRTPRNPQDGKIAGGIYTVWLFKAEGSTGFEFKDFADATSFAKAAEKSSLVTKVQIKNDDGPHHVTVWEDAGQALRAPKVRDLASVVYTTWIFQGDRATGFDFEEYVEATALAQSAEKGASITKCGVKNNESPQYLTLWESMKSAAS